VLVACVFLALMPECEKIKVPSMNDTSKNSATQTTLSIQSDHPCQMWCLLKSNGVIMVNMKVNDHITTFKLKEHIHKRGGSVHGKYLKDLVLLKVSDILESGSSVYVHCVRLIYLSMSTVPQIFRNFKSPKTQCLSTRTGAASQTSGQFNPLKWFTSL